MNAATVEHLKHFVGVVIDNFKEGQGPHGGLADSALVKSLIWQELQRCAMQENPNDEPSTVWLRLSTCLSIRDAICALADACKKIAGTVLTLQWLGSRTDSTELVGYTVVNVESVEAVSILVTELKRQSIQSRDGFYQRRE